MKERIAAVIIKNKKILLVTSKGASHYWTPGGRAETLESHEATLKRELKEELNISITSMKHYTSHTIEVENNSLKVSYYTVIYSGKLLPSQEIDSYGWFSSKDLEEGKVKLPEEMKKYLLPRLLLDKKL